MAVDKLTEKLSEDGYHVISGPRTTGDGYYCAQGKGIPTNFGKMSVLSGYRKPKLPTECEKKKI